mgnify:FL=1
MDTGKLTRNILIGMIAGGALGVMLHMLALPEENVFRAVVVDGLFDIVGKVFIVSLKLLVVPLVFVSLVCGASNLSTSAGMGRIASKLSLIHI